MAKFTMLQSGGMTYWINPDRVRRVEAPDNMANDCAVVFDDGDKVHVKMPVGAVAGVLSSR